MMRGRIRRLIVCGAVSGLLAAGAVGISMEIAHADSTLTSCIGAADSSTAFQCTPSGTVSNPATVTVTVNDDISGAYDTVKVNWTVDCTDSSNTLGTAGAPAASNTPVTLPLTLPTTSDGTCHVSATVSLAAPFSASAPSTCVTPSATPTATPTPTSTATTSPTPCPTEFTASINYTSNASPSPTASSSSTSSSVHPVKGYGGKCVDDNGNSSANRSKIQIWSCGGSDQAENWSFSNGELKHNGKCANDQGNAGSGGKVILYSCNGGSNEKWSQLSNGELKLKAHNGKLCLNDPRSSTKNGTQLIVYTCTDSANERWSLP